MTFCPKVLELHRKFYISLIDSDVPPEQVVSSCILRWLLTRAVMKEILFLIQIGRTCKVQEFSLSCLLEQVVALNWGETSILIENIIGCLVGQISSFFTKK